MRNNSFVVGIDLGATNTNGAILGNGKIFKENKIPTPSSYQEKAIEEHLSTVIEDLLSTVQIGRHEVEGIGIGVPGTVDIKKGLIVECPNTPLHNIPLVDKLKKMYPVPIFIENDANVAAIGESYFGEGRGVSNFICLTLGTGIGGGIFTKGKIYRGTSGSAGEVGHMIIAKNGPKCGCGSYGCLEAMASGTALKRLAMEYVVKNPTSIIKKLTPSGALEEIKGEFVSEAAEQGETGAIEILNQIGHNLGIGLLSLVNIFNPEKVILAGSLADAGDLIIQSAEETLRKHSYFKSVRIAEIVKSNLHNKAGVLGAAALVQSELSGD